MFTLYYIILYYIMILHIIPAEVGFATESRPRPAPVASRFR